LDREIADPGSAQDQVGVFGGLTILFGKIDPVRDQTPAHEIPAYGVGCVVLTIVTLRPNGGDAL
jgi:hypothetical protein